MKLFAEIVCIVNIVIFLAGVLTNEVYRAVSYVIVGLFLVVANLIVLLWLLGVLHG